MVTRTRLSVTFIRTYIACLLFIEEDFEHVIRNKLISVLCISLKDSSARYSVVELLRYVRLHFHCFLLSKFAVPHVTLSR